MEKLRAWSEYNYEYIKNNKPKCSICTRNGIGDFYDRYWNQIILCEICKSKLEESINLI